MEYQVAYVESDYRVKILTIGGDQQWWGGPEELAQRPVQAVLFSDEALLNGELRELYEQQRLLSPVASYTQAACSAEQPLDRDQFLKLFEGWTLNNNLMLLESLLVRSSELRALYDRDRTLFMKEWWLILKANLGLTSLRLVYHDITEVDWERQNNNRLQVYTVTGAQLPEATEANESERELLRYYQKRPAAPFALLEYSSERQEACFLFSFDGPLVVAWGHCRQPNRLQLALFKTLSELMQKKRLAH